MRKDRRELITGQIGCCEVKIPGLLSALVHAAEESTLPLFSFRLVPAGITRYSAFNYQASRSEFPGLK